MGDLSAFYLIDLATGTTAFLAEIENKYFVNEHFGQAIKCLRIIIAKLPHDHRRLCLLNTGLLNVC